MKLTLYEYLFLLTFTIHNMAECEFEGCSKREALPFRCKYCGKSFCTQHRLPENHECDKLHLGKSPISKLNDVEILDDDSVIEGISLPLEERITTYDFNDDDSESVYYTTDVNGQVYSVRPSEQTTRDRAFFSRVGDAFTIGNEAINILIGVLVVLLSFGFTAKFMSALPWKYVGYISIIILGTYLFTILPQKLLAKRFGFTSKFLLTRIGLLFSLITIISPIKYLSPGILMIPEIQFIPKKRAAFIGMIGILINLSLSICFMFLGIFLVDLTLSNLFIAGSFIAVQFTILDLIPFNFSSGKRILDWKWPVYLVLILSAVGVLIVTILFGSLGFTIIPN